ncbi:FHA domain-containing protein [Nymphaea thermarum]|nr:FHA domain-containing protein [Nymphaea thermarum]
MDQKEEERGKMIPVFTVFKNGAHVKNIILSRPPVSEAERSQEDVIMMVGRHPDCDIVLEHPSISRYHLQLKINESSKKLWVTDQSSVHGTMVSGRKMTPQVSVQVEEGDVLKLGGSTRMYKLKWVSTIFDLEKEQDDVLSSISQNQENEGSGILLDVDKQNQCPSAPPLKSEGLYPSLPGSPISSTATRKGNQGRQSSETMEQQGTVNLWSRRCMSSSAPHLRKHTKRDKGLDMLCYAEITNLESKAAAVIDHSKNEMIMDIIASQGEVNLDKENPTTNLRVGSNDDEVRVWENTTALDVSSEDMACGSKQVLPSDLFICSSYEEENTLMPNKESDEGLDMALYAEITNLELGADAISIHRENNEVSTDIIGNQEEEFDLEKENCGTNEFVASDDIEMGGWENSTTVNVFLETKEWHVVQGFPYESIISSNEDEDLLLPNKKSSTPQTLQCISESNVGEEDPHGLQPENAILRNCNAPATPDHGCGAMLDGLYCGSGYQSVEEVTKSCSSDLVNFIPKSNNNATGGCLSESNNKKIAVTAEQGTKRHQFQPSPLGRSPLNARITKSGREDTFVSDKENSTHQIPSRVLKSSRRLEYGDLDDERNSGTLLSVEEQDKRHRLPGSSPFVRGCLDMEDVFLSDKENMTPQTPSVSILKSRGKLTSENSTMKANDIRQLATAKHDMKKLDWLCGSPSSAHSDSIMEGMFPCDKENVTPKSSRVLKSRAKTPSKFKEEMILKRRQEERVPFQNLLLSSPAGVEHSPSTSGTFNITNKKRISNEISCSSVSFSHQESDTVGAAAKKKWYMVVDTSCLLNAQSRRSLKLMEGLKGTQLIIPRLVVRELDSLKHRASRFRKESEASVVMQWIEQCMVKMSWWIHVQSSGECFPVSATPPVSPHPQLNQGGSESSGCNAMSFLTASQISFSSYGSFAEIVSPTAEDHILECALLFKRLKTDGQLILLTKEVGLKIKAMAEGLICETPEGFCQSLVNPYSERFLWLESTPRGPTWSSLDGLHGLKESHHEPARSSLKKKVFTEGAKGLKLVLRHNDHYGQVNLAA